MSLDKTTVAKRYSKALFEIVSEKGQRDETRAELNQIQQVFNDNEGLGKILTDKGLEQNQKLEILNILTKDASNYVGNLIKMTFDYGRMDYLTAIIDEFNNLCDADEKIVRAKVVSAIPLSDQQLDKMAEQFAKRLKVSEVVLGSEVDDSIIGGAIIKTDSLIYDGSIQTQINQIRQRLIG